MGLSFEPRKLGLGPHGGDVSCRVKSHRLRRPPVSARLVRWPRAISGANVISMPLQRLRPSDVALIDLKAVRTVVGAHRWKKREQPHLGLGGDLRSQNDEVSGYFRVAEADIPCASGSKSS